MSIAVGDVAPDFTLKDTDGQAVALSSLLGDKAVAVVFIPFAFTGVCQGELCELRDNIADFERADVALVAISCDASPSQKEWARQQGFTFPLLSDFYPHGATAQAYGCFDDQRGCATRRTVLVGRDGIVLDVFETSSLGEARTKDAYDAALAKL